MVGLPARLKATVDPPPDGPVRTKKLGSTVIESDTWPTPVRYGDGPKGRAAATGIRQTSTWARGGPESVKYLPDPPDI